MEISQFYDVNKRTQTEQVLKNMEDISDLQTADATLQGNIDAEEQARTIADESLAYDIGELQSQVDALGNVFTLKGSVATYADLPVTDNNIGDVWYVEANAVGYVWIDDNGTQRWEQLGLPIDLSDYVTTSDLALALDDYQPKLTAGTNISIIGDTISATQPDTSKFEMLSGVSAPSTSTVGAVGQKYLDTTKNDIYVCTAKVDNDDDTFSYTWLLTGGAGKQNKLTAGANISIVDDTISASGGTPSNMMTTDTNQEITGVKSFKAVGVNNEALIIKSPFGGNAGRITSSQSGSCTYLTASGDNTGIGSTGNGNLYLWDKNKYFYLPSITSSSATLATISDIKHLYQHNILIKYFNIIKGSITIFNDSATQMDISTICLWLYNNGFNANDKLYQLFNYPTSLSSNKLKNIYGLYSTDGTLISGRTKEISYSLSVDFANETSSLTLSESNFGDEVILSTSSPYSVDDIVKQIL